MTVEVIVPKPALAAAISLLKDGLAVMGWPSVFVGNSKPGPDQGFSTYPDRFVKVTRSGGGMNNMVTDRALLLTECWAVDSTEAESLSNACRALYRAAALRSLRYAGAFVRGWDEAGDGPIDFPDPSLASHSRWQFLGGLLVSTN